jgi:hypothetical protein
VSLVLDRHCDLGVRRAPKVDDRLDSFPVLEVDESERVVAHPIVPGAVALAVHLGGPGAGVDRPDWIDLYYTTARRADAAPAKGGRQGAG